MEPSLYLTMHTGAPGAGGCDDPANDENAARMELNRSAISRLSMPPVDDDEDVHSVGLPSLEVLLGIGWCRISEDTAMSLKHADVLGFVDPLTTSPPPLAAERNDFRTTVPSGEHPTHLRGSPRSNRIVSGMRNLRWGCSVLIKVRFRCVFSPSASSARCCCCWSPWVLGAEDHRALNIQCHWCDSLQGRLSSAWVIDSIGC